MTTLPYDLFEPENPSSGLIVASPHSGRDYPASFLQRADLDPHTLRSSEDAWVDRLVGAAPSLGAPLLAARSPRAFVDFNRSPDELDPSLIEGVRRLAHNPRVTSGLGVVPRVVAGGRAIYRGRIALAEAQARLDDHWRPYHTALAGLMKRQHARFGRAILIDCHSMPHEAIETHSQHLGRVPEVVLGDRFGTSADSDVMDALEEAFQAAGLAVARNTPFAGAFISQHYGRPALGQHVVQIEIDRALYMDEDTLVPHDGFDRIAGIMTRAIRAVAALGRPQMPLAAE